jgi:two-component system, NtrC family, response regulator AtoC
MADRIIVAEDDDGLRDLLADVLEDAGYEVRTFPSGESALRSLEAGQEADLVLTDLVMPGLKGHDVLRYVRENRPETPVVVLTAFGSIDSAIELVKSGAFDYLTKPVANDELLHSVERALAQSETQRAAAGRLRDQESHVPDGVVAASPAMLTVLRLVARAGPSPHPVLITGESGTGKEVIARALHGASGRDPFVAVNCGAIPEALLESELFGHERGSFTGAEKTTEGLFAAARGGTLFLDEIGDLPVQLQPKLLRALEGGEIRKVGGTASRAIDVRVIAATNRDIEDEVRAGRFREDLFWRLSVLHVDVPPLRERPDDVMALAHHFLNAASRGARASRLTKEAEDLLRAYSWPGNVRELRNALQRAATLAIGESITGADLPSRIRNAGATASMVSSASRKMLPLREVERAYVLEILRAAGGNKTKAASILGLDRKTLHRKLEEYAKENDQE